MSEENNIRPMTLWGTGDVVSYLGITHTTIKRWIKEKSLPCYRFDVGVTHSSRYFFKRDEIDEWIKKFEVNPHTDKKDSERDLSWARHFYPYHDEKGEIVFINEVNPNDKNDQQPWGRVKF